MVYETGISPYVSETFHKVYCREEDGGLDKGKQVEREDGQRPECADRQRPEGENGRQVEREDGNRSLSYLPYRPRFRLSGICAGLHS